MTQRNLLANNRVFYDPGTNFYIKADLSASVSPSALTIPVADTSNLMPSGYAVLGTPGGTYETIYYASKTASTLVCPTGGRGTQGTTAQSWNNITYPYVQQKHDAPNALTTDTQQAGWYVNPVSRQASLRVYDAPVILPGVIRFTGTKFQGCKEITASGIVWQDFNAEKGDPGTPGSVTTTLDFTYPGSTDTSNAGLVMKTLNADVATTPFELRSILPGSTVINQVPQITATITTGTNSVTINPRPLPYDWDFTSPVATLKGVPGTDILLNAWGTTVTYCVEPGYMVSKGQVVMIQPFVAGASTYLAVRPFIYTTSTDLDPFKLTGSGLGMVGIARETADATAETTITPSVKVPVRVVVDGHALVKISSAVPAGFIVNTNVQFPGRRCLLTTDGYGFNQNTEPVGYAAFQIGFFMESGATVSTAGNYALLRLQPQFEEF